MKKLILTTLIMAFIIIGSSLLFSWLAGVLPQLGLGYKNFFGSDVSSTEDILKKAPASLVGIFIVVLAYAIYDNKNKEKI